MWNIIKKEVIRLDTQIVKQFSNVIDNYKSKITEIKKISLNNQNKRYNDDKSLKIVILGLPNVGKSTLINFLIGRPVCATSSKIHTTRKRAAAIFCKNNIQLIFLDTPGLVSRYNLNKFKLENNFINDTQKSVKEADFIGVVQDISQLQSRETINNQIITLLKLYKETKSVLILNKIDTLKNKKLLLEIVNKLKHEKNWPHFSDVFMISALTGDGIDDLRNYFLDSAKYKFWDYDKKIFTDQSFETIVNQILKANFLDNLPQEIPYLINTNIDNIDYKEDNSINIIVNINCSTRISRLIIGEKGRRIKMIAKQSEQILCKIFQTIIRLKIIIPIKEEFKLKGNL